MSKKSILGVLGLLMVVCCSEFVLTSIRPRFPKYRQGERAEVQVERGSILGRGGEVLAEDEVLWDIHLDQYACGERTNVWSNSRVAKVISEKLGLNLSDVESKFDGSGNRYIPIKTTRDIKEVEDIRRFGHSLRLCIEQRIARRYPLGRCACHVTGCCSPSKSMAELPTGITGVELARDEDLRTGLPFQTDIEPKMQLALYQLLSNACSYTKCRYASAIIVAHRFERILALVNYPDFDPLQYEKASKDELCNRCIVSLECPGSMFRPLLNPYVTNVCAIAARLSHLGFGSPSNTRCWGEIARGRILDPELWSERYRENVLKGQGFAASTYQIAIAYARSANEANPITRTQSQAYYLDLEEQSMTNTVNFLQATGIDKTVVLMIKRPESNVSCRKFLNGLNVDSLICK